MSKYLRIVSWPIIALLSWFFGVEYNLNHDLELSWVNAIYTQKNDSLEQEQRFNRVLLFGGSGTHMGFDAYAVEKEINRPVYNFGLHAGLGLNGILSNMHDQVMPGDLIILVPEFDLLGQENTTGRLAVALSMLTGNLEYLELPAQEISQEFLELGTPTLRTLAGDLLSHFLDRELINYYSEEVDLRGSPIELKLDTKDLKPGEVSELLPNKVLRQIKQARDSVEAKGGQFAIAISWMYYDGNQKSKRAAEKIVQELEEIAPVLHNEDFNLQTDRALYGDTVFHMSYKGRRQRSQELAKQIKVLLAARN